MEEGLIKSEPKLPSIKDLQKDAQLAFESDQLNLLLNQNPPDGWIKEHPIIKVDKIIDGKKTKVPLKYIPISRVEMNLTMIFQQWRIEVVHYGQIFQSMTCHIRLHYLNPVTQKWESHDGLGAVDVQTKKGENATNLGAIIHGSVMRGLPAAKSFAIKDAADHLGKLFGRDMNRNEEAVFFAIHEEPEKNIGEIIKERQENEG